MYTPANLTAAEPLPDDRPYAGYAYLGVAHYRFWRRTLDRLQLDVGAVGPITRAGEIQSFAHNNWGGADPRGWHNQIENEPTLQLEAERTWLLEAGAPFGMQLLPAVAMEIGSIVSQLRLGTTVRIGFNLPEDAGPPRFGSPREPTAEPERGLGIFGFAGVAGRGVAYNRLISGNRGVEGPGRRAETCIGELSFGGGVVLRLRSWSIEAHYAQVVVSPEFQAQERAHRYGSGFLAIGRRHGD
jgi:hypothetical protein